MAESEKQGSQTPDVPPPPPPPPFLEVMCKTSGMTRRFAPGTKAGFALSMMNNKLDAGAPLGLYIEAVKDGEEPINFGPSSVLLSYGTGWKLQIVSDGQPGVKKREGIKVGEPGVEISIYDLDFDPHSGDENIVYGLLSMHSSTLLDFKCKKNEIFLVKLEQIARFLDGGSSCRNCAAIGDNRVLRRLIAHLQEG